MSKPSARNENEKVKSAEIGKRLYELRLKYGEKVNKPNIRQGDFGAALGIGGDTQASRDTLVGRLERGECDIKPSELQKYSQLCGVSIDYIVNGSEHVDKPAAITIADVCREIIRMDKCGMIDIITHGDRYGILFRDIWDEINDTDYGKMTFTDANGTTVDIPQEPPMEDIEAATYSDSIQQFIEEYCTVKDISSQMGYTKYGRQAAELAEKGALSSVEMNLNTTDILYRKEHPVDAEEELRKLNPIFGRGPLPKAGDVLKTVNGDTVTVVGIEEGQQE